MNNLRPTSGKSAPRACLGRSALGALVAALLVAWPLAGHADAGASDYPASLYLSSAVSTQASSPASHRLLPSGGAIGANPTVARTTVAGGTHTYTYTIVDASDTEGAPTAGTSGSVNVTTFCAGCNAITVGNLPTGGQDAPHLPAGVRALPAPDAAFEQHVHDVGRQRLERGRHVHPTAREPDRRRRDGLRALPSRRDRLR